jgi:cytochrome c556
MKRTVVLLAVSMLAAGGIARAADFDPILTRQSGLDLLSGDFSGINAVVKAKGDVKSLENPAKAIQRWAGVMPTLFPKGSETGHNTKALPEIWSDQAGFEKAAADLGEAAGKLVVAAKSGDADAVAIEAKAVGDACGACHRKYRAR